MEIRERFERAKIVAEMYPEFADFCVDAMAFLGFDTTWMQVDIAHFMQYGPDKSMVAAQRGEAKSTIACLYGLWRLTQNPSSRILLISGATDKAEENGKLMHGLIHNWDVLQYLAPDKYAGDRTSILEFDVHWALKGVDKSASVNCLGITSSLQGYRADVLIPDDIETTKNGLTATQRETLILLSKEFTSICTHGKILYLGTPQTKDSIYNGLPNRGFELRVWPGRFPTDQEVEKYGEHLAPSILERMQQLGPRCQSGGGLDGTRGWPTDPQRYNETDLCAKELDQGPETFELQFMLNTSLSDAARQQLRLRDLIVGEFSIDQVPEAVQWAAEPRYRLDIPADFSVVAAELYRPAGIAQNFGALSAVTMFLDPAGSGGDEVAFAIGGAIGPYIHVLAVGGFKGGLSDENLDKIVELAQRFKVKTLLVEGNLGAGTSTKVVMNHCNSINPETNRKRLEGVGIDERTVSGQKERRIIDTLGPVLRKHRLIVHRSALEMDQAMLKQYPIQHRAVRSVFHQLHNITVDRGSLSKDDRLDALASLVQELSGFLVIDEEKEARHRESLRVKVFINDPMGTAQFKPTPKKSHGHRALRKRFGHR